MTLHRILHGHELTVVHEMSAARRQLEARAFDMIVAAVHFDDSKMLEFIREARNGKVNANTPLICFCSKDTPVSRLMHESLECSTRVYGAWMYLEEHLYNVYQDPDAELRRVMERCLTEEARKEIHRQRLEVQRQRRVLQELRLLLLQDPDWSPELHEYSEGLKHDLSMLLAEVTRLSTAAATQRDKVAASRKLHDRVAERVESGENRMAGSEDRQSEVEAVQSTSEKGLPQRESRKDQKGPKR